MRLDHLLSKEDGRVEADDCLVFSVRKSTEKRIEISGGDTSGGHTRSHPEHDG